MSMLGVSFLNEIVRKKEITKPAEILNHLRLSVVEALKQTENKEETLKPKKAPEDRVKDGMDISIVAIHKDRKHAQWAGANNPLWIVRQSDQDKEFNDQAEMIEFIKGDKMPVAIHVFMKDFTNHEVLLNPGDRLYLFSDGFPDQFGGAKGKKFMYKKFKRLIAETSSLSMMEQGKELERTLTKWMDYNGKKYEQVDDVTVLGVKI